MSRKSDKVYGLLAVLLILLLTGCKKTETVPVCCITSIRSGFAGTEAGFFSELSYDDAGNLLQYRRLLNEAEDVRTEYTYDDRGNQLSEEWYRDNALQGRSVMTYDEGNRLLSKKQYNASGYLTNHTSYLYDTNGNLLSEQKYTGLSEMASEGVRYTYDIQGRLIAKIFVYSDSRFNETVLNRYDERGNLWMTAHYKANAVTPYHVIESVRDAWGNELEHRVYSDGELSGETFYAYDRAGNLLVVKSEDMRTEYTYDDAGRKTSVYDVGIGTFSTYHYDSAGNLIEEIREHKKAGWRYSKTWTYDEAGRMLTEVWGDGEEHYLRWTYGERGELLKYEVCDSAGNAERWVAYTWETLELMPDQAEKAEQEQQLLVRKGVQWPSQ